MNPEDTRDPVEILAEELLRRRRRGESPRVEEYAAAHPELAESIRTLFPTLIAHEPARRYQTVGEMADDLQPFLDARPIHARRISPVERFWRWCRRNRALATSSAIAVGLVLLIMVLGCIGYYRRTEDTPRCGDDVVQERSRLFLTSGVVFRV